MAPQLITPEPSSLNNCGVKMPASLASLFYCPFLPTLQNVLESEHVEVMDYLYKYVSALFKANSFILKPNSVDLSSTMTGL